MELPRGITGFDDIVQPASPDEKTFHRDCWAVVLPLGGRVLGLPQSRPNTNFMEAVAESLGRRLAILCNSVHPWVGFREPLGTGQILSRFLDPPALMSAFEALGSYRILRAEELDEPLNEPMCRELGKSEFSQVRYWRKTFGGDRLRVGDVVFNHWD